MSTLTSLIFFFLSSLCIFPIKASPPSLRNLQPLVSVPSLLAYHSPIPLAASGSCTAGTPYTVNSIDYLYQNAGDLECIFAAGLEVDKVPLGFGYGYVLSAANTGFWNKFVELVYQGDYVVKTQCNGEFYNIGWLSIAGIDVGTAVWSLNQLDWTLAKGEYPLGETGTILMDFTVDFNKLCAAEGNESPIGLKGFSPFYNSIFPLNQFKDVSRLVGIDTDGGWILLNKAYINSSKTGAHTVLFYAVKSFDPDLIQRPIVLDPIVVPLGPNEETVIEYRREGAEGAIKRVMEALVNPVQIASLVAEREIEHNKRNGVIVPVQQKFPLLDEIDEITNMAKNLIDGVSI